MKVSLIKQQIKRPDRYSIFVDGKYSFSLSADALLEQGLVLGQELSPPALRRLKELSSDDKLYGLALRYVAMRPRSRWELETYLQRKDATPALQKQILNKLTNLGFINDEDFAQRWAQNRRLLRPTSLRKLQQELKLKHIDEEIIATVLSEDAAANEQAALRELVHKKRSMTRYQDKTKLMAYLARQGFNYGDIKQALEDDDSIS